MRFFERTKPDAGARAAVILMASEAGMTDDQAKAYADEHTNPETAKCDLRRRVAMNVNDASKLSAQEVGAIANNADFSIADAKLAAVDLVIEKRMADAPSPTIPTSSVGRSWEGPDGAMEKCADALRARMNPRHAPTIGREYAGMSILDMTKVLMAAHGLKDHRSNQAAERWAFAPRMFGQTTSDLPHLLGTVMGRELQDAYQQSAPAILGLASRSDAVDFRQRHKVKADGSIDLEPVNEAGEYTAGYFRDEGELAATLTTFGKILSMTRQAFINDDLGAFGRIPQDMANGANSTIRNVLVGLLEANAGAGQTLRDGNPVFHTSHGNIAGSAAAPSIASLTAATTSMRRQKGLHGQVIDVAPWAMLVPPELETAARQLVAQITPEAVGSVNPFSGRLNVVVEPGLSDPTTWYVVADPARITGLEYAYLSGANGPEIIDGELFEIDAMSWKVRLDFGAAFVEHRSWYMTPGG